jgi:deoxycytidine triphosphate deaminase
MILAQAEIRDEVARGQIRFDPPLEERQWHEASVDLRLGFKFTKLVAKRGLKVSLAYGMSAIADAGLWKEKSLNAKTISESRRPIVLIPVSSFSLKHMREFGSLGIS